MIGSRPRNRKNLKRDNLTLNDSPIDYMHWNNPNKLVDRLRLRDALQQRLRQRDAVDHRGTLRSRSHYNLNCVCMKWISRVMSLKNKFSLFPKSCVSRIESWKRNSMKSEKKLAPRDVGSSRNCTLRREEIFRENALYSGNMMICGKLMCHRNASILVIQQRPSLHTHRHRYVERVRMNHTAQK